MYDEKRLHKEVALRLPKLGAAIGSMVDGLDGDLQQSAGEESASGTNA
jgi:hypothetical protein